MNQISGIYRIYIKANYFSKTIEEYSYIGVSKNIEQRYNDHIRNINKFLNNGKIIHGTEEFTFFYILDSFQVPSKEANAFKIAMFLLSNNLTINDLKIEILEECNWVKIEEIEDKEIEYIEKYNSEWRGFNGVFAKTFKYLSPFNIDGLEGKELELKKIEISKRLKSEEQRHLRRIEYSIKNKIKPMPWIFFNYKWTPSYLEKKQDIIKYFKNGLIVWFAECYKVLKILDDKKQETIEKQEQQ